MAGVRQEPAIQYNYGPYYQSDIWKTMGQREAVGQPSLTQSELAGVTQGELEARYQETGKRRDAAVTRDLNERQMSMKEDQVASEKKTAAVKGTVEMGALGASIGTAAGGALVGAGLIGAGAGAVAGPVGLVLGLAGGVAMGGSVICTELHRQGLIDDETYEADHLYGLTLDYEAMAGYHFWAEGIAKKMKTSKMLTRLVSVFAIPWAKDMSYRMAKRANGHWLGKVMIRVGLPICRKIGKCLVNNKEYTNGWIS